MRFTRTAAALLLVLAACGGGASDGEAARYGSDRPGSAAPRSSARAPGSNGAGASHGPGSAASPGATAAPGSTPAPVYFDDAGVGAMARRYLQSAPATSLVVEIDYVTGRRPSDQAMRHVERILERETDKPVSVRADDAIAASASDHSFDEIAALARTHRDTRSGGATASMWIVFLDRSLEGERDTVGVAITASTAAVFADHIQDASTAVVGADQIERAVLTHEVGHLLALVNIGYTSRHDHEDPQSRGHSRSRDSVMYAQIEDKGLVALITGGPADDFDAADRDDLAMLRAG